METVKADFKVSWLFQQCKDGHCHRHRCSWVSLPLVLKKTWYLLGHIGQTWTAIHGSQNVKKLMFSYGSGKKGCLIWWYLHFVLIYQTIFSGQLVLESA